MNSTIEESLQKLKEVTKEALKHGLAVRGFVVNLVEYMIITFFRYVSCVIGCPYEGKINSKVVANVTEALLDVGCYEGSFFLFLYHTVLVSLGDTIGVGSAGSVASMLDTVLKVAPAEKLAVHFHDTYGQALTNILVSIEVALSFNFYLRHLERYQGR